ncbi:MAG: hypothetical protein FH748_14235 [Balneolaceae bacterium]|nr:hypothetical protein [Balneolaceae bacterium]
MNSKITDHINKVEQAARNWLQPDNYALKEAIDQTINEGLFSFEDIKHQLLVLKENIESGQITAWAQRAGLSDTDNAVGKTILCLHAGNLPLVGFQTALGVILSGADYTGKLSRKDPYLLKTFLTELNQVGLDNSINYSTDLNDCEGLEADEVVFAGSSASVAVVKKEINRLGAASDEARYLIRTAKFSMAYVDNQDALTMKDLTEAIFRYGGKGCRSVAVVVSPYSLDSIKCEFTDYVESFWLKNPQHQEPGPALAYQFAYNKAIERSQAWLDHFLIQESTDLPDQDFLVNWVQGDEDTVRELKAKFGDVVQSIYTTGQQVEGIETTPLSQAQRPPLWWQPDGVGVLKELLCSYS